MASKFIALAEETTYGSSGWPYLYFKCLNESINSVRNDYFPETTEFWTPDVKAEGYWSGGGDAVIPVDPIQWVKLLPFFIGDGSSSEASDSAYTHTFKFGANESVGTTGIKASTILKGVGIEKDRRFEGGVIESIALEIVGRELVTSTVTFYHCGDESLTTAASPVYTSYTQPFFSGASVTTMTVNNDDRLTTAPTIENFRVTLTRGWDKDHYVLGSQKVAAATLSGFASVTGSMDFTFTSEDELERFLTAVGGTGIGSQSSFEIIVALQGALIGVTSKYGIQLNIPEAYYVGPVEANLTGRDRIIQTVNFRGNYNSTDLCAAFFTCVNETSAYSTLTN